MKLPCTLSLLALTALVACSPEPLVIEEAACAPYLDEVDKVSPVSDGIDVFPMPLSKVIEELEYNISIHETWATQVFHSPEEYKTRGNYASHIRWMEIYGMAIYYLEGGEPIQSPLLLPLSEVVEELEYAIGTHEPRLTETRPEKIRIYGDYDWHMRWIEVYKAAIHYLG